MAVLAQETVNKLLDFNQRLDIGLLDEVVGTLYSGQGEQHKMAQEVLTTLKEHPDAWTKVIRADPGLLPLPSWQWKIPAVGNVYLLHNILLLSF